VRPIPIDFHVGLLDIRLYGVGMTIAFLFSLGYTRRRFASRGLPWQWAARAFLWIVVASLAGARLFHVLANIGYYGQRPTDVLAIWKGGLSSFGGLAGGVPTGLWFQRRYLPQLSLVATLDLMAPVLAAAWIVDALFGRQLMVHAGGHPTTAWYGLYYAGEVGRRAPVPLFQAAECAAVWALLLRAERRAVPGSGLVFCLYVGLWGAARFNDEFWWLATPRMWDAVEVTGLVMAVCGFGAAVVIAGRARRRPAVLAQPCEPDHKQLWSGAAPSASALSTACVPSSAVCASPAARRWNTTGSGDRERTPRPVDAGAPNAYGNGVDGLFDSAYGQDHRLRDVTATVDPYVGRVATGTSWMTSSPMSRSMPGPSGEAET
jgi:phosphatidylglycerol:prolipoprotein diacylglycerol transferase